MLQSFCLFLLLTNSWTDCPNRNRLQLVQFYGQDLLVLHAFLGFCFPCQRYFSHFPHRPACSSCPAFIMDSFDIPTPPATVLVLPSDFSDPSSFANPHQALITHIHLDIQPDFDQKLLSIKETVFALQLDPNASHLILDVRNLKIISVSAPYEIRNSDAKLGQALAISLQQDQDHQANTSYFQSCIRPLDITDKKLYRFEILYTTDGRGGGHPAGGACDWLEPSQTSTKKFPFLFTQAQAIHARSWIACQDTPGAKASYEAFVHDVPNGMSCVMSAPPHTPSDSQNNHDSSSLSWSFKQVVPVPAYLIALAIGELKSVALSPRSTVWADPCLIDGAAHEFAETELFLRTAADLCGPYRWGRYDILVMPPSFPFGGMENPTLTFATPTLLAGDRSLADVIAHEIAHSWSGNLVTCSTWDHFWLNEGFTVLIELKICQKLQGDKAFGLSWSENVHALNESIAGYGTDHTYTQLIPNLKYQDDPDDAFSSVPYMKGCNFLFYLQGIVGGSENFDPFLRAYFNHFAYKAITSLDFKNYFISYFQSNDQHIRDRIDQIPWDDWLYKPGYPSEYMQAGDDTLVLQSQALATFWIQRDSSDPSSQSYPFTATYADVQDWTAPQLLLLLKELLKGSSSSQRPLSKETVELIDNAYHFTTGPNSKNAELCFAFAQIGIRSHYDPAVDIAKQMLLTVGRMKFVRPLYRDLHLLYPKGNFATDLFKQNQQRYHNITTKMVSKDLGLAQ